MKSKSGSDFCKPFKNLRILLSDTYRTLPEFRNISKESSPAADYGNSLNPSDETRLFMEAMADVVPIPEKKKIEPKSVRKPPEPDKEKDPEAQAKAALEELIATGKGFRVSLTPEYIEGHHLGVPPEVTRRLHRGDFSIQEYVDLHGLSVTEARNRFDGFLSDAVRNGKNALLIVHGRGLSSPGEPVLKKHVDGWLSRGRWKKWVIAYASARLCDGGAGATYVLLR